MENVALWSGLTLFGLGAFHGINPGMGWLFAVALGMQEGRRRAVWWAMLPLGLGHALAIGVTLALAALLGVVLSAEQMRLPVAALLIGLGAYRLLHQRHPRWGGMRVGLAGLTVWSFLMASAHGAGLMVLPVVLDMGDVSVSAPSIDRHAGHLSMVAGPVVGGAEVTAVPHEPLEVETVHGVAARAARGDGAGVQGDGASAVERGGVMLALLATLVHGAGYLLVTSLAAWVVSARLGLGLLRTAWINLDLVWAAALILTGALTLLI